MSYTIDTPAKFGLGNVNFPGLAVSSVAQIDASHNLTVGNVNLASQVTGVLPIANGGTNSSTALSNGHVVASIGGKIVEAPNAYYSATGILVGTNQGTIVTPFLEIIGANASYTAGFGLWTTASAFPIRQTYANQADNSGDVYDGYYDGTNVYYSSTGVVPFRFLKSGGTFQLRNAPSGTFATPFSSENTVFEVDASGHVFLNGATGAMPVFTSGTLPPIALNVAGQNQQCQVSIYTGNLDLVPHLTFSCYGSSGSSGADNTSITFDAGYDGSGWVAASGNSVFQINKLASTLNFQYSTTALGTYASFNNIMSLQNGNVVVTNTAVVQGGGVQYPSPGATGGTVMGYYEFVTLQINYAGPYSGNVAARMERIGNCVFMFLPQITGTPTVNSVLNLQPNSPTDFGRFASTHSFFQPLICTNIAAIQVGWLIYNAGSPYNMTITLSTGGFSTGGGPGGSEPSMLTWKI